MEQKFKRGNVVKVLTGQQIWMNENGKPKTIDLAPEYIGRTALIEYSYNDKYRGGNVDDYSVMFTDTGETLAWKRTDELEMIDEGGEHLFAEAILKKKQG